MYCNKKILAIIPARGGSKGIPHKNIMDLKGKPLIAYSIEAALQSKYIDYTLVSTDDIDIKKVSEKFGAEVPFLRPRSISDDNAKTIDVVKHALNFLSEANMEFDYIILLQPTSPLRNFNDIDEAIEILISKNKGSLVSVCEVEENPLIMRVIDNNKLKPIIKSESYSLRRQDFPEFYILNGAIYINKISMILKEKCFVNEDTIPYIMDRNKSIDIDNMLDARIVELILEEDRNSENRK